MASWFSQIRNLLKIELNPSKVIEVKQEKYTDRLVHSREDGIVLYRSGEQDQEIYEIVLLRPFNENMCTAYRYLNYNFNI